MNFFIQQSIHINVFRVGSLANSSVLQIGSAGMIRPISNLYNTGGFVGPAPEPQKPGTTTEAPTTTLLQAPAVPLQAPVRSLFYQNLD